MLTAILITAPGINCDLELAHAFQAAGATPTPRLLKELMRRPALLDSADLIGLPGGFSYGDDVAAGRIMAQLIRGSIYPALAAALERGVPMLCPCNGFQIAVQAGLLPAPAAHGAEAPTPVVALCQNATARFHDQWTGVEVPQGTRCVWTRGLEVRPGADRLPSAHGEGRLVAAEHLLDALESAGQVALRYADGENFNGSMRRIAGLCDPTGLVFGLMPHPERFTRWTQHPWWTRLDASAMRVPPLGLRIFQNAVQHALRRRETVHS